MTSKNLILALAVTGFFAFSPLSFSRAAGHDFNFKNADIYVVTQDLSKRLNKTFVIDPKVEGKVTIIGDIKTNEEAYNAFLIALAQNGLTTVEQGPVIRVLSALNASRSNMDVLEDVPDIKTEKFVTVIFNLKNAEAKSVYNELGPMLQSRYGEMRVIERKNALVVTDFVSNLHRVKKVIEAADAKIAKPAK